MDVRSKSAEIIEAQKKIFEGKLLIWNTRLEAILDSGDAQAIFQHLGNAVTDANNCGCNNGCGARAASEAGPIGR